MKTHWLKNFLFGLIGALVLALGLSLLTVTSATTSFYYSITELGTLGGRESSASAINDVGQIVGTASTTNSSHPFLWQKNKMTDLSPLGGAVDINNKGQIIGGQYNLGLDVHAVLWSNGTITDLGTLGGTYSSARAINDVGQVVGDSSIAMAGDIHAFLWQNGKMTNLGGFGGNYSSAYGINNRGQIVGAGSIGPVVWQNGSLIQLGSLGGGASYPSAINNWRQVVGQSTTRAGLYHAFLWSNGKMTDLGTLGGNRSYATALNNRGQIVGNSKIRLLRSDVYHAFIWANGTMKDLNDLIPANSGWELTDARDINNKGQIVGIGRINDKSRAFLLTPTWVTY